MESAATKHMQDNLDGYHGRLAAGKRCVLSTNWVGEAWEELPMNEDVIVSSFKKGDISAAADGTEHFEIHLKGLENDKMNRCNVRLKTYIPLRVEVMMTDMGP